MFSAIPGGRGMGFLGFDLTMFEPAAGIVG